jgi:hypothetical protein
MGLRSVQPAVITSKAKMEAFAIVIPLSIVFKTRPNHCGMSRTPVSLHSGLSAYCTGRTGEVTILHSQSSRFFNRLRDALEQHASHGGGYQCSIAQFAVVDEFADLPQPSQLCLPEEQPATKREVEDLIMLGPVRAAAEALSPHRSKLIDPFPCAGVDALQFDMKCPSVSDVASKQLHQ